METGLTFFFSSTEIPPGPILTSKSRPPTIATRQLPATDIAVHAPPRTLTPAHRVTAFMSNPDQSSPVPRASIPPVPATATSETYATCRVDLHRVWKLHTSVFDSVLEGR